MSVFSFVVAAAGDSFITVVLLSFFSAGGLVMVVSFCSQATNSATPASRQMHFFILTVRISVRGDRLSACYSIRSLVELGPVQGQVALTFHRMEPPRCERHRRAAREGERAGANESNALQHSKRISRENPRTHASFCFHEATDFCSVREHLSV